MASPQTENGYTMIANELFDALIRVPIGNSNAQVLYAIMRKTYGWNKKEDKISITQICKATKCARRTVIYSLQNLEIKRMIKIKRSKKSGAENEINSIAINKNYNEWVVQEITPQYRKSLERRKELYYKNKNEVVQEKEGSARNGEKVVQETVNDVRFLAPTKDTLTKDIIQKKTAFPKKAGDSFYLTKKKKKLTGWKLETFKLFWIAFNWPYDKANAADAWLQIPGLTQELAVEKIIPAAKHEAENRQATLDRGSTPKWAQGWLSSRRWEDENPSTTKLTYTPKMNVEKPDGTEKYRDVSKLTSGLKDIP